MSSTVSYPTQPWNEFPQDAGGILRVVTHKITSDKRIASLTVLWLFGLLAVFLLPSPVRITEQTLEKYKIKLAETTDLEDSLSAAKSDFLQAEILLNSERAQAVQAKSVACSQSRLGMQGWFPWFKSAREKKVIARLKTVYDEKKAVMLQAERAWQVASRNANKELGLFSEHGIQAARRHFWDSFEKGKIIGRRNTFWDGIFLILGRRYESMFEMVINLAFYLVANMTAAMFVMFWFFVFGLPSLIWSLGGSWVGGVLFFCIAVIGAASVMISFIGLLSGTTAAAVYGLYSVAKYRLEAGPSARRRELGDDTGYRRTQVGAARYYRPDNRAPRPHAD